MENKTVYSKTARGMREAADKTKDLPKDLRKVLKAIDGKSTFQDLLNSLKAYSPASLEQAVTALIQGDYIRKPEDVSPPPAPSSPPPKLPPKQAVPASSEGEDLDFTSFASAPVEPAVSAAAKIEAEAKARQEAETKARLAAEAKAREAAEVKAKQEAEAAARRKAAEEQARKEAEEKVKQEAETRAKLAAEAKARQEAEERLRREAEAKVKLEMATEARRKEAEEKARQEAETKARMVAEAKAKQEAEAEAAARRKAAEEQARKEAEEKAKQEAEAKARLAAEAKARQEAETKARLAAEAKAREAAEAKARQEAEAEAAARRKAAEEQTRKEAEEKAKQEAETKARLAAEAKARQEAEERLRHEAEAKVKLEMEAEARRKAAEEQAKEAEEKLRREAEAKARQEAEAAARRKAAEEHARKEVEEKAKQEAETRAKLAAEAKVRQEAEERLRHEAEAKVKLEMEAVARRKAAEEQAKEAEEKLRREAEDAAEAQRKAAEERARGEEQLRQEAETKARQAARELAEQEAGEDAEGQPFAASKPSVIGDTSVSLPRIKKRWGRKIAQAAIMALAAGVAIVHVVPFDGQLSALEKSATAQFGQPVKAGSLNFWLLPTPHWRLHDVTVGDHGQIRVALVKASTSISALFGAQAAIATLDMEAAKLDAEGIAWVLLGKGQANGLGFSRVTAKDVQVSTPLGALPVFNANATVDANGNWQKIELQAPGQKFNAELSASGEGASVKLNAAAYTAPLSLASEDPVKPAGLMLSNFSAVGTLSRKEFVISEFSGEANGGYVNGKARLNWDSGWSLNGEARAKAFDPVAMFPALSAGGILGGSGSFAMQGVDSAALLRSMHAEGSFLSERGSLQGIDLSRVLRGLGGGGRTSYATLDGKFTYRGGKTQLRNVMLIADAMTASGNADVTADKQLSGRFAIELKSPSMTARSSVSLAGTLDNPRFGR